MAGVGDVVLPGDGIHIDFENPNDRPSIVIGPGLRQNLDSVIATKPGVLRFREPAVYWIDCHQKRVRGPVLILGAGRIVGAPSDWFKRSRDET